MRVCEFVMSILGIGRHTRSMIVAVPMPAPMQSVTSAVVEIAPLQFVEHGAEDHRAGRAERMAHRDRAARNVDLVVRDVSACM